ncbi:uncharacterized protein F5891DRAFT_1040043 [Suillus fuscotomentosus]|uniref:Uncharacterized protein n=1 Tax=Suillus fuscotomentosus TaxID=1912939 RepID=A0AAD4E683_9AGAM|nr:uncharacterized protein F5891DRAFT_1040043 [Suillus fuscotomentosus]KAG1899194.1 hypothetical protein F5891DRAFT_1040043 [Suillus fuscotomentosus]
MHSFHYLSVTLLIGFSGVQSSVHDRSRRLAHVRALSGSDQPRALDISVNQSRDTKISKRDTFTYFQDGNGACGGFNGPNDYDFAGGSHCFQTITITVNGKSAQAQIVDECLGCPCGGLDFSQGLFEFFASTSVGELSGSWSYGTSASTSSTLLPSTTTQQSSTSTWTSPTTTSSSTPTPTSTLTTTSTLIATTTPMTSVPLPTTSSSTASPLPAFSPDNPQILAQINLGLIEFGSLLQACAASSSE